jgi:hypothetical protein
MGHGVQIQRQRRFGSSKYENSKPRFTSEVLG